MHPKGYDPAEHFEALADDREAKTGRLLLTAADTFREAVIDFLEAAEDECEAVEGFHRPSHFPETMELFVLTDEVKRLVRIIERRRALSYVLATTAEAV
jgi:hypothetical protein